MSSYFEKHTDSEEWKDYLDIPRFTEILSTANFIYSPAEFIQQNMYDADDHVTNIYLEMIYEHNKKIVASLKNEKEKLLQIINCEVSDEVHLTKKTVEEDKPIEEAKVQYLDLTSEAKRLIEYKDIEELKKQLILIPNDRIESLKFAIFKIIKSLELEIKRILLHNPTTSIKSLQSQIESYQALLGLINYQEEKSEQQSLNHQNENKYNLIFLPDSKNGTCLYDDVAEYPDRYKEIKNALDKIVNLYFLSTHDIENLKGPYGELWQYKNRNGIRILYFLINNNIIVTSLFFKDKQKSTRISLYYEEAINRLNRVKENVLANVNDPNFIIEQNELLGEIYSLLESQKNNSLTLKAGE